MFFRRSRTFFALEDEPDGWLVFHATVAIANRRAELDRLARERHTTPSELMRGLIDSL